MARLNIREIDPVHYDSVKASQDTLREEACTGVIVARLCPYCRHKMQTLYSGKHGPASAVCTNCGEEVFFPTISFRIAQ